jgi:hypothetical protein
VWQLSGDGLIYLVADRERAGRALFTLIVDDLEERLRALRARGIDAARVETYAGARKATIVDPDGNLVGVGEVVPAADP